MCLSACAVTLVSRGAKDNQPVEGDVTTQMNTIFANAEELLKTAGFTMAEYFRDRGQHALIVIDDLHWADHSTQDFATALARTMHGAFALLLTFRSDELTRRLAPAEGRFDVARARPYVVMVCGVMETKIGARPRCTSST